MKILTKLPIILLLLLTNCSSIKNLSSNNIQQISIQLWCINPDLIPVRSIHKSDIFTLGKRIDFSPTGEKISKSKVYNLTPTQSNLVYKQYKELKFKKMKNSEDTLKIEFRTAGIIFSDSITIDTFYIGYGFNDLVFNGKSHISMNSSVFIDSINYYIFDKK